MTLGFQFLPKQNKPAHTHPREKRISSLKIIKHFEKVKPFTCVQSANYSEKGDVTSGKVRGERKVVSGQETATGNFQWPLWEAGVLEAAASPSPPGFTFPQSTVYLGLTSTLSSAGPSFSLRWWQKHQKRRQDVHWLAQGSLPSLGRQPARTCRSSWISSMGFDQ